MNKEPLGLQVAGKIISVVEQYSEPTHHDLFFDNFFTSHGLLQKTKSQSLRATGTVREKQNEFDNKNHEITDLKKRVRCYFDYRSE